MRKRITVLILALCVLTLAACGGKNPGIAAPKPSLIGNTLSWSAISGAEKYIVTVNGEAHETEDTGFELNITSAGEYDIYVTAVKGDKRKTSDKLIYKVTSVLPAPTVTLSGNVVTWAAIANASGYEVYLNGALAETVAGNRYSIDKESPGDYKVKVRAKGGDIYSTGEFSDELTFTLKDGSPAVGRLASPVITLNERTVSWQAVENAASYKIFIDGIEYASTTETQYTLTLREEGSYKVSVRAFNPPSNFTASAYSNEIVFTVNPLDLKLPVFPAYKTTTNVDYTIEIGDDGYVGLKAVSEVTDYSKHMWYLEPSGENYFVKLYNGFYLTRVPNGETGPEATAALYTGESNQQWVFVADGKSSYKLQNVEHGSQWGYHYYYGEWLGVFKFSNGCTAWTFENMNIPFVPTTILDAPVLTLTDNTVTWSPITGATGYEVYVDGILTDTVTELSYTLTGVTRAAVRIKAVGGNGCENSYLSNEIIYVDAMATLFANPVVAYYNNASQTLAKIDENGELVIGDKYDTVSDYSEFLWTVEKIAVENNSYYMIKLPDGRYLTQFDNTEPGEVAATRAAAKNEADSRQWWKFIPDAAYNDAFKLENVYFSAYWPNVYLGEWYGVYKFNGGCLSWTFFNPVQN